MWKYLVLISFFIISLSASGNFPFILEDKDSNFIPKINKHVYQNIKDSDKIVNLKDVDFKNLNKNIKIIYVGLMPIKKFYYSGDDLYTNIMVSYKYGDKEKAQLDSWIAKGGILWLEAGFYATGKEIYSTDPKTNLSSILRASQTKSVNNSFLDFPVKNVFFTLSPEQMQEVAGMNVKLLNIKNNENFIGVNALQINLHYFTQTYFILEGTALLNDADGRPLATINSYGKGKIISLFPYEYRDPNYNGEDFRWKLVSLLDLDKSYFKKSIVKSSTTAKKVDGIYKGYCIQLFGMHNEKVAFTNIKKASNLDLNRLEKRGKYFVGRTGAFYKSKDAKEQLSLAKKKFKSAYIRKCDYNPADNLND